MLLRQEVVPRVPRFALPAGIGCDKRDMEPALEQLDFGLGLVVPIAAPPRPRIAGRGLLGNDHHAPAFAVLHRRVDTKARHLARESRRGWRLGWFRAANPARDSACNKGKRRKTDELVSRYT